MSEFIVGGVVPLTSPAFVTRAFEQQIFGYLSAGDWVTLLGPRQHGKTSALVRLRERLIENGLTTALIDLHAFPSTSGNKLSTFLSWFVVQVRQKIGSEPVGVCHFADLNTALEAALDGTSGEVILLIDETSRLPAGVAHGFFAQLRAIHTAQRSDQVASSIARLSFLFAGTFRPDTVIDDDNSPFNVSRIVATDDLTTEQIHDLAERLAGAAVAAWSSRIFDEVGGQPYLVQLLLDALAAGEVTQHSSIFEAALAKIASGADGHLPALFRRITKELGAEDLLRRMVRAGGDGMQTSGDGLTTFLTTVGIARVLPDLRVIPRNKLYSRALEHSPSFNPDAFLIDQHEAPSSAGSRITNLASKDLGWIQDAKLRAVVQNLHDGGVASAEGGHYRLALAGLGAAYEGMVLAYVEQIEVTTRESIRLTVVLGNKQTPPADLRKCTFEGLVLIAHKSGKFTSLPEQASHIARDWRNLIHPEKARREFQTQDALLPEVQIIAALIVKLVQHLR